MNRITEASDIIPAQSQTVHTYLSDLNNIPSVLPKDKVSNVVATQSTLRFTIDGMAEISMKLAEEQEAGSVKMISEGKNPFPFQMKIIVEEEGNNSKVTIQFDGDVNTFMKMMIENPLKNFLGMMAENLKAHYA